MKELHATIAEQCARVGHARAEANRHRDPTVQLRRRCEAAEAALNKIARAALRELREEGPPR